jgi:hypothetical protein
MKRAQTIGIIATVALLTFAFGCAPLSRPVTQREQTAAVGGLAGGAGGALIGSMTGGAVAGGLFGIPIGAVVGWYAGDQLTQNLRNMEAQLNERDKEIDRLKRENERFRGEERDRSARNTGSQQQGQSAQTMNRSMQQPALSERDVTGSERMPGAEEVRQAQQKLNDMGYDAGHVDGIMGAETRSAISNFQRSEGLAATGQLDKQTMKALSIDANR